MVRGPQFVPPPRWFSGKCVRLMTWWLSVGDPVEVNFISGIFHLLPPLKHVRKVVGGFGKNVVLVLE